MFAIIRYMFKPSAFLICFIFLAFIFIQIPVYTQSIVFSYDNHIEVQPAIVREVISTDTLIVSAYSKNIKIRLLGVSQPTEKQLRNYFNQNKIKALDRQKQMLEGVTLYLVTDNLSSSSEFEPLPRYVFLRDMTFLNTELIKNGLATYFPESEEIFAYHKAFEQLQKDAQKEHMGIWHEYSIFPINTHTPTPIQITPSPTTVPLPTATPTPSPTPTLHKPSVLSLSTNQQSTSNSLSAEKILSLINNHRKNKNLEPFQKNDELCQIAQTRAPQLYDEIFITRNVHAGFYDLQLPYWTTENMAHYESEEKIIEWWLGSTIHRNALEGSHTYSCGACQGNSCVQLFTSFVPK